MLAHLWLFADDVPRWSYTLLDGSLGALAVYALGMIARWIRNREDRLVKKGRAEQKAETDRESLDEFKVATRSQTKELKTAIGDLETNMNRRLDEHEIKDQERDDTTKTELAAIKTEIKNGNGHA